MRRRRFNQLGQAPALADVVITQRRADPELIRDLYIEHGAALLGYVSHLVAGDRQLAEDIVQETLLRAWRHPESLTADRGDVRPWLWTVARRLVIDRARARQARPEEVPERALSQSPAEDELDRALESWQMVEALRLLTPAHRAVLVETYYLGRSVSEAAAVLAIPVGTVKSRASYALRALRLILTERGVTS